MSDGAKTQLRDVATFFSTLAQAMPSEVEQNDATTKFDIVGALIDALDNEAWQIAAGHSNRMANALDGLDINALYKKFDVEEYSGGIPDSAQEIDGRTELQWQVAFDIWEEITTKLVAGLAE